MRHPLLLTLLLAACATVPTAPPRPANPAEFALTGTISWEGHFDRPHATRSHDVTVHLLCAGERSRLELIEAGPGSAPPERTVFVRDADGTCWLQDASSPHFTRDHAGGEHLLRLLQLAATEPTADHALPWQHPRLGDLADRAEWLPGATATSARQLHVHWYRESDQAELVLQPAASTPSPSFDVATAFDLGEHDQAPAVAPAPAAPRFTTLAPGVHEITLPDVDTRSLAIEFTDHVVLCESSLDNAAGERLLAALDEHLPGKPVRYVLFGHYHPHYTGGLRPVMARGATVVAPPLGAALAREIGARVFASPPDALAASGRTPTVETFTGERTFRDEDNELVAIDIGADSHHTVEYVVFWLPRQQMLFEGDLGWFGVDRGMRAGGVRARGLVKAIDDRKLPVVTLVQSWPTTGPSTLPLADLRAMLAK